MTEPLAADPEKNLPKNFPVPTEIIDYFADKKLKPAFSWLDVWGEEHAYAFTVAKAVETELLSAFQRTIQESIQKGEGFESWKKRIMPELERLGWDHPREVEDPTGKWKSKTVNFAAPKRLENIFWSNVRTARAAAQWARIQRTKNDSFILYVRTASTEPRAEHLQWVGLILPVDHEFWLTHFPPNGWNCKCSVRQVSAREAEMLLKEDGYSDDASPFTGANAFTNARTGEVVMVPVGIDPGWGTNPGAARAKNLPQVFQARLDEAGPAIARRKIAEWLDSPAPRAVAAQDPAIPVPVAVAEDLAKKTGAASPIVTAPAGDIAGKDRTAKKALDIQRAIDDGRARVSKGGIAVLLREAGAAIRLALQKTVGGFLKLVGWSSK